MRNNDPRSSNSHECPPGEGGAVGVAGRGVAGTLSHIARTEGARALYSGLVPGLQRQMAFSAIRIGAYERVSLVRIALEYNTDCALIAIFGILTKTTSKQQSNEHIYLCKVDICVLGVWKCAQMSHKYRVCCCR